MRETKIKRVTVLKRGKRRYQSKRKFNNCKKIGKK